jgi:hypothetical protein
MSAIYQAYLTLELEWSLARVEAGGQLTNAEEMAWTERAMDLWRRLTPEEQSSLDLTPLVEPPQDLMDCSVAKGEEKSERRAA